MSNSPRAERPLRELRGLIMNMDGVLYRGDEPVPGLVDFFRFLDERGLRYLLLTNNSTTLPEGYVRKLAKVGVRVPAESILSSGLVALEYLRERYPAGTRFYGVCMPPCATCSLIRAATSGTRRRPKSSSPAATGR